MHLMLQMNGYAVTGTIPCGMSEKLRQGTIGYERHVLVLLKSFQLNCPSIWSLHVT